MFDRIAPPAIALIIILSSSSLLPAKDTTLRIEQISAKPTKPAPGETTYAAQQVRDQIRIDGQLSDWKNIKPIILNDKSHAVGSWKDSADLSARAYIAWDGNYLYFACDVNDDITRPPPSGDYIWTGDAIQLAIALSHRSVRLTSCSNSSATPRRRRGCASARPPHPNDIVKASRSRMTKCRPSRFVAIKFVLRGTIPLHPTHHEID